MRLPTVMPLYAFEGGGNRTVFSCRSCASRLILACHLVCALISSGINTRYLDLVYAPVKAKLEHFGATTPRLLSSAAKHLALLWLRLCHLHLGNSDYFACKNLPLFCTIRRWNTVEAPFPQSVPVARSQHTCTPANVDPIAINSPQALSTISRDNTQQTDMSNIHCY